MKKIIFAAALIAALIPFAVAQDSRAPQASLDREVDVRVPAQPAVLGHPIASRHEPNGPAYCKPCLFYGGDFDANDSDANGLANEVDLIVNTGAAVYTPFVVPVNKTWTVTGLFTNNLMSFGVLDPVATPYEVRDGIGSGGTGGNLECHGTLNGTSTPTGRNGFGFNEYTVAVSGITGCTIKGGSTTGGRKHWLSVVPICTNSGDSNCGGRSFESNTEDTAWSQNHHFGLREPANDSFFNSVFFGAVFANTQTQQPSVRFSAGVSGSSN